uniref:Ig-like domain-containing protein n=1 Tax=Naja naja TaxID=35670 RepID=A0A8C6VSH0_NAJNA
MIASSSLDIQLSQTRPSPHDITGLHCFLFSLPLCKGITSQPTLTQPVSQSGSLRETIELTCGISSNPNTIGWLQQKSGEAPRFVHCDGCSSRGEGIPDRFTATRSGNNGYLTITNLQAEDEADYYCSMWYSSGSVFHSDTK